MPTADRRRSDAWTESETRRRQVEADFRIAMDQRRKEALTALTAEQLATRTATEEMRERAHAEGRRMVEAARREAAQIVADAEAAVVRLREQRQRMVAQLAASRADLDAARHRARPAPGRAGFRAGHPAQRLARRPALARVHAHTPPALIAAPVVAPDRHARATAARLLPGLRRRGRPVATAAKVA